MLWSETLSATDIHARSYCASCKFMKRNALEFCDWDSTQSSNWMSSLSSTIHVCARDLFKFQIRHIKVVFEFNQWNSERDQTDFGKRKKIDPTLFKSVNSGTPFELKPRLETIVFNNYKWSFTSSKMECSSTWKNSCRIQSIRFTHVSCHVNQCLGFILDIGSTHFVYLDITNPSIHVITN